MSSLTSVILLFVVVFIFLTSCSTKRLIPDGKLMMRKNEIAVENKKNAFTKSDLSILVGQKTRRHFLNFRFGEWSYYVSESKKEKKFWKWFNNKFAKEPIYFEHSQCVLATEQMTRYLQNVGYFNAKVSYDTTIRNNKFVTVKYKAAPSLPYRISDFIMTIPDTALARIVFENSNATLIKNNAIYNAYTLDDERDRITISLKNKGYYNFTKDYILFDVDSSSNNYKVAVDLRIENRKTNIFGAVTDTIGQPHQRFHIHKVKVFPLHEPFIINTLPYDTTVTFIKHDLQKEKSPLYFLSQGNARIKPGTFNQVVQIYEKELFSINNLRQTYKGISNLKIYRGANITFDTVSIKNQEPEEQKNWLDCNIYLQRNKVHAYSFEVEGTNSAGDLGIRGSLVYTNKNLFRGAEVLRVRLNGGFEAQKVSSTTDESGTGIFNTTESGIDVNIYFPRFVSPIALRNFIKEYQPKTNLNIGYSLQDRQDYYRFITKAAFSYDWMSRPTVNQVFTPINLNSVKVDPSQAFQEYLDETANQRYKDQYSNHLIFSLRYSLIYNNQNINKLNDFVYYRINFESSGNLLSLLSNTSLITDEGDYEEFLGIRYSQFFRVDHDFRYYRVLTENNKLVFRTVMGIGIPYGNSNDLPFERSFYSGGANSMRGWQYRQLGPGSYNDTLNNESIGDIQLEANVEYRFPIYSYLKGGLFIDVGNIWTLNENETQPGAEFKFDTFYKDLAVDAGLGFRVDFSFFVFRLDAAVPIRDPAYLTNERWQFNNLNINNIVWNFGIGYPF